MLQECPKSGRSVALFPGLGTEVHCPDCGRTVRLTKEGKLRVHAQVPVLTEATFDPARRDGRGEYVATIQIGRVLALYTASTAQRANAEAHSALTGQRRREVRPPAVPA